MNPDEENVAGLVLAAGASTRMGKPKQLLPAEGQTMLGRVLGEALGSNLNRVILVLGYKAEEIKKALGRVLRDPRLDVIENQCYEKGLSSSIIAGLSEIKESHRHALIMLGDMPCVYSSQINWLIRHYLESNRLIGAVKTGVRRSHPVIFSHELYHELFNLKGDRGAKSLFLKYKDSVCLVEPEGLFNDIDIDTPEDFKLFQDFLAGSCRQGV